MKTLETIIGKTAYWGLHTFIAVQDPSNSNKVRIDVYRNLPYVIENFYYFDINHPKQIEEESLNESSSLRFYTGKLHNWNGTSKLDEFLECFKHVTKSNSIL